MTHIFNYGENKFLARIISIDGNSTNIEYLDSNGNVNTFIVSVAAISLKKLKNLIGETVIYKDSDGIVKIDQVKERLQFCYLMKNSNNCIRVDQCYTLEYYQSLFHIGDNIGIRFSFGDNKLIRKNFVIIGEYDQYICAIGLVDYNTIRIAYVPRIDIVPPDEKQSLFEDMCSVYKYDPVKIINSIEIRDKLLKSKKTKYNRQINLYDIIHEKVKITPKEDKKNNKKEDNLPIKKNYEEMSQLLISFLVLACMFSLYYQKYFKSKTIEEYEPQLTQLTQLESPNNCYFNYSC